MTTVSQPDIIQVQRIGRNRLILLRGPADGVRYPLADLLDRGIRVRKLSSIKPHLPASPKIPAPIQGHLPYGPFQAPTSAITTSAAEQNTKGKPVLTRPGKCCQPRERSAEQKGRKPDSTPIPPIQNPGATVVPQSRSSLRKANISASPLSQMTSQLGSAGITYRQKWEKEPDEQI